MGHHEPPRMSGPVPVRPVASSTPSPAAGGPVEASLETPPTTLQDEGDTFSSEDAPPDAPGAPRFVRPSIAWRRVGRTALKVGIVVVVVSVALGGAAAVAAGFYAQYGPVKDGSNARSWAALTPLHVGQAACATCHQPEVTAQDASIHVNVSCEGCHGPGSAHATRDPSAMAAVLTRPDSRICITCHGTAAGRPASFPVVDPATHYSGGPCLRCHDPHSITAVRPPIVSHPLTDLPACTTCHAPDGLKKIPEGHTLVADPICLSCHGKSASGRPR